MCARRFFAFARERLWRLDLGRIDQALVDAYARHLRDDPARRPVIVGQLLQVVTDLYHLRDHLPDGGLGFEPWAGRAAARVAGYRHVRENRTPRSEEHTSELQSLMRISSAVFCLKKKRPQSTNKLNQQTAA